jgi:excisionase family DNA binding protein
MSANDVNKEKHSIVFRPSDGQIMPWNEKSTISTQRAAEILGVSSPTVRRMIESGDLMAYQVRPLPGSPWRVNYSSLIKFVELIHERNGLEQRF